MWKWIWNGSEECEERVNIGENMFANAKKSLAKDGHLGLVNIWKIGTLEPRLV